MDFNLNDCNFDMPDILSICDGGEENAIACANAWRQRGAANACVRCRDCQTSECTLQCTNKDHGDSELKRMDCVGKSCDDEACRDALSCGYAHPVTDSMGNKKAKFADIFEDTSMSVGDAEAATKAREAEDELKKAKRDALMAKVDACKKYSEEDACNNDAENNCSWDSLAGDNGMCLHKPGNASEFLARVSLNVCDDPTHVDYYVSGCA
jgi:hypothetical protein